jgi:hypothetical protein
MVADQPFMAVGIEEEPQNRTLLVLVHGVGMPDETTFGTGAFTRWISARAVIRVDWHGIVERPFEIVNLQKDDSPRPPFRVALLNRRQLAQLMRGFIGSAGRNASTGRVHDCITTVLQRVLLPAPLALFLALILAVDFIAHLEGSQGREFAALMFRPLAELSSAIAPSGLLPYVRTALQGYAATILFLCSGLFACVLAAGGRMLTVLRHVIVSVLWPVLYCVAALCSPLGLLVIAGYLFVMAGPVMLPRSSAGPVPDLQHVVVAEDANLLLLRALLPWYAVMFVTLLAAIALTYIVMRPLAWMFKVIADVLCFLGDEQYAERLKQHVGEALRQASVSDGDMVIIAAHSLGSVIVAETLLSVIMPNARVVLVTLGSPLRRMVARFFGDTWPAPDQLAHQLRQRHAGFVWLNVYRPWDPIGTKLFRQASSYYADASTRQWTRFGLAGHANYWDDPRVAETARTAFEQLTADTAVPKPTSLTTVPDRSAATRAIAAIDQVWTRWRLTAVLVIAGTLWLAFHWFVIDTGNPDQTAVWTRGKNVDGWIYRYEEMVVVEGTKFVMVPLYVVVFPLPDDRLMSAPLDGDYVSSKAARSLFKGVAPTEFFRRDSKSPISGQRVRATIRYFPERPRVAIAPTIMSKHKQWPMLTRQWLGAAFTMTVVFFVGLFTIRAFGEIYAGRLD